MELAWFGDVGRLLGDIGNVEKTGELMSTGMDWSFVLRWTCHSIMSSRLVLRGDLHTMWHFVSYVVMQIESLGNEEYTSDERVEKIDED